MGPLPSSLCGRDKDVLQDTVVSGNIKALRIKKSQSIAFLSEKCVGGQRESGGGVTNIELERQIFSITTSTSVSDKLMNAGTSYSLHCCNNKEPEKYCWHEQILPKQTYC